MGINELVEAEFLWSKWGLGACFCLDAGEGDLIIEQYVAHSWNVNT